METKICNKCKEEKSLECFAVDKRNKYGFTGVCKSCKVIRDKQYREDNPEKIKQYNKQYNKQYHKDNPEKFRLKEQRRMALKQGLPNTFTIKQWKSVKEYFNNKCAYCGEDKPLTQDHHIALSKGGEYTHNNIIPACKSCNSSKRDKDFFKWYPTQKQHNKERESKILTHLGYTTEDTQQLSIL